MIRSSAKRWSSIRRKSSRRSSRGTPGASVQGSVGKKLLERGPDRRFAGEVRVLELGREGDGRIRRGDERGRRVEQLEALARDEREDLPGDAGGARRLLEHEQARRLR